MFTSLGLPMNCYTFVLSENHSLELTLHLRKCLFRLPVYIVIQSLKDILYGHNFLQRSIRNFEIHRRVLTVKKMTKFKKNTHTPLSLYLSILRCTLIFRKDVHAPVSLSWSLSVYLQFKKRFGSRSEIVSEYDQEIPQSQTADNPVAPGGRAAQPSRDTRKTN